VIVVTGGAGFIGSNLVHALVARGEAVRVVDDLEDGHKFTNLAGADIADYEDMHDFYRALEAGGGALDGVSAVFHQGACSDTTEWDGRYVMRVNYRHSRTLLDACLERRIPLVYASSAAVYGAGDRFAERPEHERPINVYGWSKQLFDRHASRHPAAGRSQVVGLRYFNVYGPREDHKGRMASVARHLHRQVGEDGEARLFRGSGGYADGEQRRDFVHVDDVVAVNLWCLDHPECSGVYNVGTGRSRSFNDLANAVIRWHGRGRIRYVPFPEDLEGHYQSFTEADLTALRGAGCDLDFVDVEAGVARYLDWLTRQEPARGNA